VTSTRPKEGGLVVVVVVNGGEGGDSTVGGKSVSQSVVVLEPSS